MCAGLPDADDAAVFTLRLLARRIQQLTAEARELARRITKAVGRRRLWLPFHQLPPYAPEFNPVKGVWSILKRPCQTEAVPNRSHRRPHGQDRARTPGTVTSAIEDL
ncbi:transposase [Streptomyces tubercidicus]|uniref:transposase n=1 Tax=Streptomyces tubercidicus TaxID=47759 RepID=UPI00369A269A